MVKVCHERQFDLILHPRRLLFYEGAALFKQPPRRPPLGRADLALQQQF